MGERRAAAFRAGSVGVFVNEVVVDETSLAMVPDVYWMTNHNDRQTQQQDVYLWTNKEKQFHFVVFNDTVR